MVLEKTAAACRLFALSLGALVLHGCAVVTTPGFDYADPKNRTSIALGEYVPADANNPPQGVIVPITPGLVQSQRQAAPKEVPAPISKLFGTPAPYTIGVSDIVAVIVYDHPELLPLGSQVISQQPDPTGISSAPGFIVDSDGVVAFPYVGRVKIAGLTEAQAGDLITARISRVIKEPQVTVRISSFRSRRAYVEGEVRTPGQQIFTDVPMTLPEAINRAGGILPTGDRSFVTLTRNTETTRIDLMQLQDLGVNPGKILLQPGDLVTVRNRDESKVYVMGEILRPMGVQMHNGRLTLNEALGEASGPNLSTANTSQIYVIRNTGQDIPAVYHLNAGTPTALALAETFALRPRDVVYIDPVPLVNWNRIISLILPTAQTLNVGSQIVNR
jgi:polysaccharide export outer membrane protein